jgi:hypothetical protein
LPAFWILVTILAICRLPLHAFKGLSATAALLAPVLAFIALIKTPELDAPAVSGELALVNFFYIRQ